ncbi:MAG: diiron oxygenase [Gammaproteobacteria bacterium]|nr:diiron oxygenase [Gammaproteobacteria bacterium]
MVRQLKVQRMQSYSPSNLVEQLSRNSTPYYDPLTRIHWDLLSTGQFWLPPEAISLHGIPAFMELPPETRRRLSQYEFLNFVDAGLWLEGIFMERIVHSMRSRRYSPATLRYRLHELREEAGHSLMFVELMERSGLAAPPRRLPRLLLADLFGRHAPMESAGFWLAILLGEEMPDRLNRYLRRHSQDICPAIIEMSTAHVIDEARHIAYALEVLKERLAQPSALARMTLKPIAHKMISQFIQLFYYPSPALYETAGLTPGYRWAHAARSSPQRAAFVGQSLEPTLQLLRDRGLDLRWHRPAV